MKNILAIILIAFLFLGCKKDRGLLMDQTLQGKWTVDGYRFAYFDVKDHQISPYTFAFDDPVEFNFDGTNLTLTNLYSQSITKIAYDINKHGKDITVGFGSEAIYMVNNWNIVKESINAISLIGDITHATSPPYYVNGNKVEVDHVLIKLDLKRVN